ncbi:acetylcholine receptor subunit alpha-like [Elysia marginata]|uniref:Acetylcholine receptor subunit alpha-like n=1 Tax=Elysia marginata TaxID=1093978 RepID=A0AAV4F4H5_9GAST|nr:acetylcholine receptor subunit alpha-like [Elysia marginata]
MRGAGDSKFVQPKARFILVVLFNFLFTPCCPAHIDATQEDFLNLTDTLLKGYKRHVRPIANQSAALDISLDFNLISIYDVDDVNQVIFVFATTLVSWYDESLVWDPNKFGGFTEMHFGPHEIWAPKIYFLNSHHKDETLFDHPTHHEVTHEGKVVYFTRAKLSCQCKLDLVLFPSDQQRCEFPFAVFDSSPRDVNFEVRVNFCASNSTLARCTEHGEWDVLEVHAGSTNEDRQNQEKYVSATSVIKFRRRPEFYYLNIYAPVFSIAALCVLTFFVPVDSGERLAYALSMHLSLSVYIGYIGDILPMASLGMPNVFYVVSALFFSSVLCVAFSALNMALRWSIVTTTKEGKKKIKVLCFNFYLSKKGPEETVTDRSNSSETSIKRNRIRNLIGPFNENPEKKEKLFIVFPTDDSFNQYIDEKEGEDDDHMTKRDEQSAYDQSPNPTDSASGEQKSPGILDPDLIRLCNALDYYGFVLVFAFIVVIVIMTMLQRKWF